jgi:hypothetical protein
MASETVIAGLDPAIHPLCETLLAKKMDARVKPGHDRGGLGGGKLSRMPACGLVFQ